MADGESATPLRAWLVLSGLPLVFAEGLETQGSGLSNAEGSGSVDLRHGEHPM